MEPELGIDFFLYGQAQGIITKRVFCELKSERAS